MNSGSIFCRSACLEIFQWRLTASAADLLPMPHGRTAATGDFDVVRVHGPIGSAIGLAGNGRNRAPLLVGSDTIAVVLRPPLVVVGAIRIVLDR